MKSGFLLLVSWLIATSLCAQINAVKAPVPSDSMTIGAAHQSSEKLYDLYEVDTPPRFPGGEQNWLKFQAEHIRLKPTSDQNGFSGVIRVIFVIESDGSMSNLAILRESKLAIFPLESFDQMPHWSPALKDGQQVAVRYILPIRFCFE